ncbi:hypothetical protein AVEN_108562-1 [Araneus ventricosus]|uniref:Uncharacterized protein n=1 Tax=Araneus ventricosus TaxID=182803 RepID=A0A4Y2T5M6_ARAVE|nr:hypothetical protein AVEN_108562-1 [Araneus ventricosus]
MYYASTGILPQTRRLPLRGAKPSIWQMVPPTETVRDSQQIRKNTECNSPPSSECICKENARSVSRVHNGKYKAAIVSLGSLSGPSANS